VSISQDETQGQGIPTGVSEDKPLDAAYIRRRIVELAKLSRLEYDRVRTDEAKRLGIRTTTLDAEVEALHPRTVSPVFPDPEPWALPVEGTALLAELVETISKHIVLPTEAASAAALWVLHAWAQSPAYPFISPILLIRSPTKRCGKTTLLKVLRALLPPPLIATSASSAVIFRAIEEYQPTLMLDEIDTWLKRNEELRGILNGGHTRATARVLRVVGDDHEIHSFSTFCPKVFAGIGRTADTLEDRAINIKLKRKGREDRITPLREDTFEEDVATLRRKCRRWSCDNLPGLRQVDPLPPPELNDRAADNWRPLLSIADTVGGDWPKRARKAALALDAGTDDTAVGTQLLRDIRVLFAETDRIESARLADALGDIEESRWAEFRDRRPLTAPQLAKLLKPFEIAPRNIAVGDRRPKGYLRSQFEEAWTRYLDLEGAGSGSSAPVAADSTHAKPYKNSSSSVVAEEEDGNRSGGQVQGTSGVEGDPSPKPSTNGVQTATPLLSRKNSHESPTPERYGDGAVAATPLPQPSKGAAKPVPLFNQLDRRWRPS